MSGGGNHLKDEVRMPQEHELAIDVDSVSSTGLKKSSNHCRSYCRPCIKVLWLPKSSICMTDEGIGFV